MHLITRLTSRNLHLLALRISSYLSLKADIVLKHWASTKIARSKSSATDVEDGELCKVIVDKFEKLGKGAVSYADIARRAWEVGRAGLATKVSNALLFCFTFAPYRRLFANVDFGPQASRPRDARFGSGTALVDDEGRQVGVVEGGG